MKTKIFSTQVIFYFLLMTIAFSSCDPPKRLQIKTANKPNYSVSVYANNRILPFQNGKQNEKIILHFPDNNIPTRTTDTTFNYGIGVWPGRTGMQEFAKDIDSIIIVRNGKKQKLITQKEITEYLLNQRHGFGKSILTIEAK